MFEKEAEEYAKDYSSRLERKLGFQDGAEYGYNSAYKEFEAQVQKYSKQADDFENMKAGLESEITRLKEKIESDKELIHKLRLALIQERTANLCNGTDAVKMFDDLIKATAGATNDSE